MKTSRKEFYFVKRIIATEGNVVGSENLLKNEDDFVSFSGSNCCTLTNEGGARSSIIIDFGREICGGVRIVNQAIIAWRERKT